MKRRATRLSRRSAPAMLLVACFACLPAVRPSIANQSSAARAFDPGTWPARDSHQGFLIAADPYLTGERSEAQFGKKHPYGAGLLAVDVYLRNDAGDPARVTFETIELRLRTPADESVAIEALGAREAAELIVAPGGAKLQGRRTPIPGRSVNKKSKDVEKMTEKLQPMMLPGDVVPPHATVHGFVFFDVNGHFDWLNKAVLYVPDVSRLQSRDKLFYFEIDLSAAQK